MSYRNMLTHRCDIFHLTESKGESGGSFGVPIEDVQVEYEYPESPDLVNEPCYFTEKNQTIVQGEPNQTIIQSFLVHFLPTADVRVNDKVVWNGVEFKLQMPKKIRNHHIEVTAVRSENL